LLSKFCIDIVGIYKKNNNNFILEVLAMKKILFIIPILLVLSVQLFGDEQVYGPVQNYRGMHDVTSGIVIPTTCESGIVDPVSGEYHVIKSRGGQEFEVTHLAPVFVDSYMYINTPPGLPFDPDNDTIRLTEIFALDEDPGGDPDQIPPQRGFTPGAEELIPLPSPPYFEGLSGAIYPAFLETLPVGDLPGYLPDYDTSMIGGDPSAYVYLFQLDVPASDFVKKPFEFRYEYMGYFEQGDPQWRGAFDPEYPYQHYWELIVDEWSDVEYISDVHIEEPWRIVPGYVQVVPPDNWVGTGITVGRMGYEANEGAELGAGGGSFGIDWRVNGKIPQVIPGHVILTKDNLPVSSYAPTMVPEREEDLCGDWGYSLMDANLDCVVNLEDLGVVASEWLQDTDPQSGLCQPEYIVGIGMVFDHEDTTGPSKLLHMLDCCDGSSGLLDPNDVILRYRGVDIYCGAQLYGVIQALPDLTPGETVTMEVIKEGHTYSKPVTAIADQIDVVQARGNSTNKRCVGVRVHETDKLYCRCTTGPYICAYAWQARRDKNGKIIELREHCADTGGNVCHGDWNAVK
jgi:hypothetical protein